MLAYILAVAVALGSFAIYMAAFFFPEIHRKGDLVWSGVGLFYGLVLWFCAGRITGAVLLGQTASVTLLGWFGWQALTLRRQATPVAEQTQVSQEQLNKISVLPGGMTNLFKGKSGAKPVAKPKEQAQTVLVPESPSATPAEIPATTETVVEEVPAQQEVAPVVPEAEPTAVSAEKPKMFSGLTARVTSVIKGKPKEKPAPQQEPEIPPVAESPPTPVEPEPKPEVEPQPIETIASEPAIIETPIETPTEVEQMPAAAALEGAIAEVAASEDDEFDFEEDLELAATEPAADKAQDVVITPTVTEVKATPVKEKVPAKPASKVVSTTVSPVTELLTKIQGGIRGLLNVGKKSKSKSGPAPKPQGKTTTEEVTPQVAAESGLVEQETQLQEQIAGVAEGESAIAPPEASPTADRAELIPPDSPDAELVEAAKEAATVAETVETLTPEVVEELAPEAQLTPPAEAPIEPSEISDPIAEAQQFTETPGTETVQDREEGDRSTADVGPAHPVESDISDEETDLKLKRRRSEPALVDPDRQPAEAQSKTPSPAEDPEPAAGESETTSPQESEDHPQS